MYLYKGIAIFGVPGSGKTSVAKVLARALPGSERIEASERIIYPVMFSKKELPKREGAFIRMAAGLGSKKKSKKITRHDARIFFIYLKNKYSPSVVAKTLVYLLGKKEHRKFTIISGVRGYGNALYLRRNGYVIIYLKAPKKDLAERLLEREKFSKKKTESERAIEERLFSTNKVEKIAHFSLNTANVVRGEIIRRVAAIVEQKECARCMNAGVNPAIKIRESGLCDICEKYRTNFSKDHLKAELKFLLSEKGSGLGKYDTMMGVSGGKDSTAALYTLRQMGFNPLAFSMDTGYYPKHIFQRAKDAARKLGVDYIKINARKYLRPHDRASFKKTAALYAERDSAALKEKFARWYAEGRRHYSVKCAHAIPFVRTCQLCRRIIIRAYYGEAVKCGVKIVVLGMNEWAGLSQDTSSKKIIFSAVRKLRPLKNKPPVYIVHLPFLLRRKSGDTKKILRKLGWKIPRGESFIESNANSCLFARAAENKARRLLGFHPDASRLSREVTAGFITKKQGLKALGKIHSYSRSVAFVLKKAKII